MNSANAKVVIYFITFSMGFSTGTFIQELFGVGLVKPVALVALVLIAVSTVLFITRAYEDDDTKALLAYKQASEIFSRYDELVKKGEP
jgi:multisubunit Na+/H+ antiporter MnhB subunit